MSEIDTIDTEKALNVLNAIFKKTEIPKILDIYTTKPNVKTSQEEKNERKNFIRETKLALKKLYTYQEKCSHRYKIITCVGDLFPAYHLRCKKCLLDMNITQEQCGSRFGSKKQSIKKCNHTFICKITNDGLFSSNECILNCIYCEYWIQFCHFDYELSYSNYKLNNKENYNSDDESEDESDEEESDEEESDEEESDEEESDDEESDEEESDKEFSNVDNFDIVG